MQPYCYRLIGLLINKTKLMTLTPTWYNRLGLCVKWEILQNICKGSWYFSQISAFWEREKCLFLMLRHAISFFRCFLPFLLSYFHNFLVPVKKCLIEFLAIQLRLRGSSFHLSGSLFYECPSSLLSRHNSVFSRSLQREVKLRVLEWRRTHNTQKLGRSSSFFRILLPFLYT
jgi:hypothetical protein